MGGKRFEVGMSALTCAHPSPLPGALGPSWVPVIILSPMPALPQGVTAASGQ